ncbi:MAG: hypothetical protein ACREXR_03350 [Gammaproteobacteria bacterium]
MFETIWVEAHHKKKGRWEEYEEKTGDFKKGLFGEKAVTIKKKRWVELNEYHDHIIDGKKLSADIKKAIDILTENGFTVHEITPVLSGRYSWSDYGRSNQGGAPTCASWGYSVTEGVVITAKKVNKTGAAA